MRNPFEVGGQYRNRRGDYEVVSLDSPQMVIRYSDGEVLETTVDMQRRIWRNIQMEERIREAEATRKARAERRQRRKQRGGKFEGLVEADFQKGVTGTSWRRRTHLGGLLSVKMSEATGTEYQSHAIYRQPEVHVAQPQFYRRKGRRRKAKFVLRLSPDEGKYGFHIVRSAKEMDDTWDWTRFSASLESNEKLQEALFEAMSQFSLQWEVYFDGGAQLAAQAQIVVDGLEWRASGNDAGEVMPWPVFAERLNRLESGQQCDLYLCSHVGTASALAAGVTIADQVVEVFRSLVPLYEASVG